MTKMIEQRTIRALLILFILLSVKLTAQTLNGFQLYSNTILNNKPRTSIVCDNAGNIWLGLGGSTVALQKFDGTNWTSYAQIVPSGKVNALAVDGNDLWIGTDSGLVRYNGSSTVIYNTLNSGIVNNKVLSIDCLNGLVCAGTINGFSLFDGIGWTSFNSSNSNLASDTVNCVKIESSAQIWIGHNKGMDEFNGTAAMTNHTVYAPGTIGSVNCIYIDQQHNKWIGGRTNGVVYYDNTSFRDAASLFRPIGALILPYCYSICKGPRGGVLLVSYSWSGCSLTEITSQGTYVYHFPDDQAYKNGLNARILLCFNALDNKVYFTSKFPFSSGSTGVLGSFDLSAYQEPLAKVTAANSAYLDINNVKALINPSSDIHSDLAQTAYEVPKGSQSSPAGPFDLWMGAKVNNVLHVADNTYRQSWVDYWPGPLDTITATTDSATMYNYNRVWKVNRFDIENFVYNYSNGAVQNGSFTPAQSIIDWPANSGGNLSQHMAPYVDVNGDGVYNPFSGDYPKIKGDQMIWWVYNDVGADTSSSNANRMGIEVHASAYAFTCDDNSADSNKVINYTTFYEYEIFNRSQNILDSFQIGLWEDADLGNFSDDYIGCNVRGNYGYVYNGDNYDDTLHAFGTQYVTNNGYGDVLPVLSWQILNGPKAVQGDGVDNNNNGMIDESNEKCLMGSFNYYDNTADPKNGNPTDTGNKIQFYNLMRGLWKDGSPMTYGGIGIGGSVACKYVFPGTSDPTGIGTGYVPQPEWTEVTASNEPTDCRFLMGCGPFRLMPGASERIDIALVFSYDSINCFADNFCPLQTAAADNARIKQWYAGNTFPSCLDLSTIGIKPNPDLAEIHLFPNPANTRITIQYTWRTTGMLELYDAMGNKVYSNTCDPAAQNMLLNIEHLSNGVYLVRATEGMRVTTARFVKIQ